MLEVETAFHPLHEDDRNISDYDAVDKHLFWQITSSTSRVSLKPSTLLEKTRCQVLPFPSPPPETC